MSGEKSVSIGFRVTPEFKRLLGVAAQHDHRTMTNLLEKLLTDHCRLHSLLPDGPVTAPRVLTVSPAIQRSSAQRSGTIEKT